MVKNRLQPSVRKPGSLISFIFLFLLSFNIKSQTKSDSLWNVWNDGSKNDTIRLNALDKLCIEGNNMFSPDSVIQLADIAYKFAEKKNLKKHMAKAAGQKANAYTTKSDYFAALKYNKEALRLSQEIGFERGVAASNGRIGICYLHLGDFFNASHYLYKALRFYEKTNDVNHQVASLANIALIYYAAGQTDSCVKILKNNLAIVTKLKDKRRIAEASSLLGEYCYYTQKMDEAIFHEEQAIKIFLELNNPRGLALAYMNLSKVYQDRKDSIETKKLIFKAMDIYKKIGGPMNIAQCQLNLGLMYSNCGNTAMAIELLKLAFDVCREKRVTETAEFLAYNLSKLYMKQKNVKEGLKMYELQVAYKDSNYKDNAQSALAKEGLKYDYEKKESFMKADLDKKLSLVQLEAAQKNFRKNLWLTGSLAFLLILALSGYFIYHNFRQKNIIATQKNNILKQQLLVSQMNPHFIFNSLTAIQNFIFKQDSYKAGIYLNKFSSLIRMILDFSRKDLISLNDEFNFLQSYLELQKVRFDNKLNYELKIDPKLERETVMIPPMLAQPFVENAIEHGIFYKNGEGFLSVKISLDKNTLLFEIEDDGIGLGESLRRKNESAKKHQSLAIQITKERIETMNAQNKTDFKIEIKDKALLKKETSGVYVKFGTPYLTL